jgi:excisionase family DNA binding protein
MTEPDLISTRQAADLKGVDITSIRRALERGALQGYRAGWTWLVSRRSLEAWTPIGHRPKKTKRPYRRAWMSPDPEVPDCAPQPQNGREE